MKSICSICMITDHERHYVGMVSARVPRLQDWSAVVSSAIAAI